VRLILDGTVVCVRLDPELIQSWKRFAVGLFLLTARTPRRSGNRHRCAAYRLVVRESSDGQEREKDSEDNPNVNAHQSLSLVRSYVC